jgi:glucose dehydrogenase
MCVLVASLLSQGRDVNWAINGGDNNIRFSPLTQVNKSNVKSLVAWTCEKDHFTARKYRAIRS